MSVIDNLKQTMSNIVKSTGEVAKDFSDSTKLRMQISNKKKDIQERYIELGKQVYQQFKDNNLEDELAAKACREIDTYQEEILGLKDELEQIKKLTSHLKEGGENALDNVVGFSKEAISTSKDFLGDKVEDVKDYISRKGEDAEEALGDLSHKFSEAKEDVAEKANELKDKVAHKAEDVKEDVQDKAEDLKYAAEDTVGDVKHKAEELKHAAEDKVDEIKDKADEAKREEDELNKSLAEAEEIEVVIVEEVDEIKHN